MKDFQPKTKPKKEAPLRTAPRNGSPKPAEAEEAARSAKRATLIRIPVLSALFWMLLPFSGASRILLPALAAALIHEAGHLLVIRLCGISVYRDEKLPFIGPLLHNALVPPDQLTWMVRETIHNVYQYHLRAGKHSLTAFGVSPTDV